MLNILIFLTFISFGLLGFPCKKIESSFVPYVSEYEQIVRDAHCPEKDINKPSQIFMRFGHLEGTMVGYCQLSAMRYKIVIDQDYWLLSDEDIRFQLMAHELTHCMFLAEHSIDPDNYMYPTLGDLKKEKVILQIKAFLKEKCK